MGGIRVHHFVSLNSIKLNPYLERCKKKMDATERVLIKRKADDYFQQ